MATPNPAAIERAGRCLELARRDLQDAQKHCNLARVALLDAGRESEAAALEMVCASVEQNQKDVIRWRALSARTRAFDNHIDEKESHS